ncbi:MAG: glycoside hydrolase [Bacteroidia bacterium]|jgi:1,4-alpha-glucan branching enzyme|nr:isoamylase early set domain-containing protein [Bacteroidales bacterium]NCD42181.1 glycoside hydrolase [Bacteroidia bacterium]MDD2323329.1 isoamylase early set domain-containing protein [Bacteroidales bacterium]MDD3010104.1 isoamylase early set domain-containing protein [Bacteroidales bacterium]MDD3962048.1 isoamylase early set domain-containing protein [Bacteroidales bacterium]
MSTTKHYLKGDKICKVKFKISAEFTHSAQSLQLAGDFNAWNTETHPMKPLKDGSFTISLNLPTAQTYQFRYLADGVRWITDPEADGIAESPYSDAKNAVLIL